MSGRRLLLSVSSLSALALLASVGPAAAESTTTRDAGRDVVSVSSNGEGPQRVVTSRREGDARRMRVTHGAETVRVAVRLARLSRPNGADAFHALAFRTDRGRADLSIYVHGENWQGDRSWDTPGRDQACDGLRTRIDYRRDSVVAVVPRACLKDPRWVRVGFGTAVYRADRFYADDVNLDGRITDDLAYGPRVRRG